MSERPPAYLHEINYFRLGYQLAAQRLNLTAELEERLTPGAGWSDAAFDSANQLSNQAQEMLDWFAEIERPRFLRGQRALKPAQERLKRFLRGTIYPGAQLLKAGSLLSQSVKRADQAVARLLPMVDSDELSYRSYYNLACYESTRHEFLTARRGSQEFPEEAGDLDEAYEALRRALSLCTGAARADLVQWAEKDPSLQGLRVDRQWGDATGDLLASYAAPAEQESSRESEHRAPGRRTFSGEAGPYGGQTELLTRFRGKRGETGQP